MKLGQKYEFLYFKTVQISSTLSDGCHPSWAKGKTHNFCSDGCESVKPCEMMTHAGWRKGRKEALNVHFASAIKH